jgi:DNA repair protein RadC
MKNSTINTTDVKFKFEAGRTYTFGWIGDSELKTDVKVIRRTEKSVWFQIRDEEVKRTKINVWSGEETFYPTGKYSMCPTCRASKVKAEEVNHEEQAERLEEQRIEAEKSHDEVVFESPEVILKEEIKEDEVIIETSEDFPTFELKYKTNSNPLDRTQIRSSSTAYSEILKAFDLDVMEYKEEFGILCLNRANKVLGWAKISSGGASGTVVDAKMVFQNALLSGACCIILCHNHPSGNLKPSNADIALTKKLKQAGEVLDITVFDHLIITTRGYYSFADEGMM